jgi:hypothetical protein|tara:strand:+ start:1653 stop:1919 length:267 start_codon:yes stop_codon:yes gene_type:complete
MSEKSTFHETKEVVSRLREPIKIKAVPYATTKVRGHQIQLEMNISWDQIDQMVGKDSPIEIMVENMKTLITGVMESEYLGLIKVEKEI